MHLSTPWWTVKEIKVKYSKIDDYLTNTKGHYMSRSQKRANIIVLNKGKNNYKDWILKLRSRPGKVAFFLQKQGEGDLVKI